MAELGWVSLASAPVEVDDSFRAPCRVARPEEAGLCEDRGCPNGKWLFANVLEHGSRDPPVAHVVGLMPDAPS